MEKIKPTLFGKYFGLYEPFPDKDGLYNGRLIPMNQAKLLFNLSHISFITVIVGLLNNYTWHATSTLIGSCIAHFYWSNPINDWRRKVDIVMIQFLIWTHLRTALDSPCFTSYATIQTIGALFYLLSLYSQKQNEVWASTIFHGIVHICANISLITLYTS